MSHIFSNYKCSKFNGFKIIQTIMFKNTKKNIEKNLQ